MEINENLLQPKYPVEYYGSKHKERLLDELTGRGNVYALIRTLHNQVSDFPDIYSDYLKAIEKLKELVGPDRSQDVQKLMVAIDMQCGANMYWAGVEGLKMNYQHFVNPMAPNCTWPNVDFDDFLRTGIACSMPLYQAAEGYINSFRNSVPGENEDVWDAIRSYCVSLELDGMKLAHYHGYLAGNDLLRHSVPGYEPDYSLELAYTHMLEQFFGRKLRMDEWDGIICLSNYVIAPIELSDPQSDCVFREEICKGK